MKLVTDPRGRVHAVALGPERAALHFASAAACRLYAIRAPLFERTGAAPSPGMREFMLAAAVDLERRARE